MDQNAKPTKKRKFRFRFSLLSFLIFVLVVSLVLGLYVHERQSLEKQWEAAEILQDLGAVIETHPPYLHKWVRYWFPEDKNLDIKTVSFKSTKWGGPSNPDSAAIAALKQLPYLQCLYLERAGITDRHIETISQLRSIQRLSLWGNEITASSVESLAKMPNLRLIDLKENPLEWQDLLPFGKRPDVKVIINKQLFPLKDSDEIELLSRTGLNVNGVILQQPTPEEIYEAIWRMPNMRILAVNDGSKLPKDFVKQAADFLLLQPIQQRPLRIYLSDSRKFGLPGIKRTCQQFGKLTQKITVECDSFNLTLKEAIPWQQRRLLGRSGRAVTLTLQQHPEQRIVEFRFVFQHNYQNPLDLSLLKGAEDVPCLQLHHKSTSNPENVYVILKRLNNVQDFELIANDSSSDFLRGEIANWQTIKRVALSSNYWRGGLNRLDFLYGLKNLHTIELDCGSAYTKPNDGDCYRVRDLSFVDKIPQLKSVMVNGENRISDYRAALKKTLQQSVK